MCEIEKELKNSCKMMGVSPAILPFPYPDVKVTEKNLSYAEILKHDFCGMVSELSAITQYIHTEIMLSNRNCPVATVILGIAMAEMIHLQKLGELIELLGGCVDYQTMVQNQRSTVSVSWNAGWLRLQNEPGKMLRSGIEAEKAAIAQYKKHMQMIKDPHVCNMIARIIQDEEYHISLLQSCQV